MEANEKFRRYVEYDKQLQLLFKEQTPVLEVTLNLAAFRYCSETGQTMTETLLNTPEICVAETKERMTADLAHKGVTIELRR